MKRVSDDPGELTGFMDEIEKLLDKDDPAAAAALARKVIRKHPDECDLWSLLGESLEASGDLEGAIAAFSRAADLDPQWASVRSHLANLQLEVGAIGDAARLVEEAFELATDDAEAAYVFAMICEIEGDSARARRFYKQAAGVDPERFIVPTRVSGSEFARMVKEAVMDMPDDVRDFLGDVPVLVQDMPERDERGMFASGAPLLLGECVGTHMEERGALDLDTLTPPRILVYKLNLERVCADRDELKEQIRITVLHEVLHFLGLDENEVDDRGLG